MNHTRPKKVIFEQAPLTADEIAILAYDRWLSPGCRDGSPEQDWIQAGRILTGNLKNMGTSAVREIRVEPRARNSKTISAGVEHALLTGPSTPPDEADVGIYLATVVEAAPYFKAAIRKIAVIVDPQRFRRTSQETYS